MGILWYAEIILYGLGNKGSFLSNLVVAGAAAAAVVVSSLAIWVTLKHGAVELKNQTVSGIVSVSTVKLIAS